MSDLVVGQKQSKRFVVLRYRSQSLRHVTAYSIERTYEEAVAVRDRWLGVAGSDDSASFTIVTMTGFSANTDSHQVVYSNLMRIVGGFSSSYRI